MRGIPNNFFDNEYNKLEPECRAISIKILDILYYNKKEGLSIQEICEMFHIQHTEIIRKTIDKLSSESINYITQADITANKPNKKTKYVITEYGQRKLISFYSG